MYKTRRTWFRQAGLVSSGHTARNSPHPSHKNMTGNDPCSLWEHIRSGEERVHRTYSSAHPSVSEKQQFSQRTISGRFVLIFVPLSRTVGLIYIPHTFRIQRFYTRNEVSGLIFIDAISIMASQLLLQTVLSLQTSR